MNLRKLARDQPCQIRIPGVCNGRTDTTVLAHYRLAGFSGTSLKPPDWLGAFACSACHDVVDGRVKVDVPRETIRLWHAEGVFRTWGIVHAR
jgi:hypothetical protein